MTDIDRIRYYIHREMGVDTTVQEMSVSTPTGIVNFGMIGYLANDTFLVVISPDNSTLKMSSINSMKERMELVKKHFPLFKLSRIDGVIVCEQFSKQILDYAAECQSIIVLEINEESIPEVLS